MNTTKQGKVKPVQANTHNTPVSQINKSPLPLLWLAGILLITYIAYFPSLKNGFTNWDDNVYIGENTMIKKLSGANIKKMFDTENHVSLNYHPITIFSLALDYKLSSGYNAKRFHTTNLIFHLLNTALVFWFIFLLSDKKLMVASIVALFFGIHPMHVESVAWISERKDVLYVFFFMSALIVYLKYLNAEKNKILLYLLILVLFLFSLLSKAMAVVLPLIFLLIDYYKERKFDKNIILEKLPFFGLSIIFGWLASHIQSEGAAIAKFELFSWIQRIAFASYGFVGYIYKLIAPTYLSCFYPYPHLQEAHLPVLFYICPFILLGFFALIIVNLKKNKTLVFGFLFYFFTVALVLQFISVGQVIMADRYAYLSYIGLLFPIAMGYDWLQQQTDSKLKLFKQLSLPLLIGCTAACIWLTIERIKVWKNSETLWTDAIKKYPESEAAYRNRGSYLINKEAYDLGEKNIGEREIEKALKDFDISIALNPNNAKVFTNRANIHGLKGHFDLALSDYSKSIELDKTDEQIFFNRGITYTMMKQYDKAIEDFSTALKMKSDFKVAKESRAYAYVDNKNYEKAISELNELIQTEPTNAMYYFYRGTAYFNSGNAAAALTDNSMAIQYNPNNSGAYFNRSVVNKTLGKFKDALNDALKAQNMGYAINPNYINELKAKAN
jgi:protein O-mannosyl-transferase